MKAQNHPHTCTNIIMISWGHLNIAEDTHWSTSPIKLNFSVDDQTQYLLAQVLT